MFLLFKTICFYSLIFVVLLNTQIVLAEDAPSQCPTSKKYAPQKDSTLNLSAARVLLRKNGKSILRGRVQAEQGTNRVRAEGLTYDSKAEKLKSSGKVLYTNCDPRSPSWFLEAEQVSYDLKKEKGLVKNAWLHFSNIPVFYIPRYRFFNDNKDRRSGFLVPKIGNSGDSGRELSMPLYLNIASNKDMTITPLYLSKRGLQMQASARYLYPLDSGDLGFSWLDDKRYDDERYSYYFNHNAAISDKFSLNIGIQRVSDDYYLEDFENDFNVYGDSYLRSHLQGNLFWRGWDIEFLTEKFDRADHSAPYYAQPYQIRPQFSLGKDFTFGKGLSLDFFSQTSQFVNKYAYITDPTNDQLLEYDRGMRFYNTLRLEWQYRRPSFHFEAATGVSHTHYNVYRSFSENSQNHKRSLPFVSMKTGLVFEKDLAKRYRSTLEPELFYVKVPYRNQDDLPVFDTYDSEFRFARLFDVNRFNGIDRVSDEDRVTMALSSRILHKRTGIEAFRASIGKSYYLKDPRVNISDEATELSDEESNIAGEVSLNLNNKVRLLSSLVWNTRYNQTMQNGYHLSINGAKQRQIGLFYRQRHNDFEQAGIGFKLPLSHTWNLVSGVTYDIDSAQVLNTFGVVKYQSCCWGLSFGIQRRLKNANAASGRIADGELEYDNFIGFQFGLEGFGTVGDSFGRLTRDSIFFE